MEISKERVLTKECACWSAVVTDERCECGIGQERQGRKSNKTVQQNLPRRVDSALSRENICMQYKRSCKCDCLSRKTVMASSASDDNCPILRRKSRQETLVPHVAHSLPIASQDYSRPCRLRDVLQMTGRRARETRGRFSCRNHIIGRCLLCRPAVHGYTVYDSPVSKSMAQQRRIGRISCTSASGFLHSLPSSCLATSTL